MTTQHSALTGLQNAKRAVVPWAQVGKTLIELERSGASDVDGQLWVYKVGQVSGYGTAQLRRMTRMIHLLDSLEKQGEIDNATRYHLTPVTSLDVINRLLTVDRPAALTTLELLREGGVTYRDLLEIYEAARLRKNIDKSPMRAGREFAKAFNDTCMDLVRADPQHFSRTRSVEMFRSDRSAEFVNATLLLIQRSDGDIVEVDGVTCHSHATSAHGRFLRQTIHEMAYESTFFRHYWAMLPQGDVCGRLADELHRVGGFENVGLAAVIQEPKPAFMVLRTPNGLPPTDRRSLLKSALNNSRNIAA